MRGLRDALRRLDIEASGEEAIEMHQRYCNSSGRLGLQEFNRLIVEMEEFVHPPAHHPAHPPALSSLATSLAHCLADPLLTKTESSFAFIRIHPPRIHPPHIHPLGRRRQRRRQMPPPGQAARLSVGLESVQAVIPALPGPLGRRTTLQWRCPESTTQRVTLR